MIQVGRQYGAVGYRWQNNTRHEMVILVFPDGRRVNFNISKGMNFDEVRVKKTLGGVLRREGLEKQT